MVLKPIALTGADGMVGRHMASALASAGFQVIACSRGNNRDTVSSRKVTWDLGQWRTFDEFDILFEGAAAIVHAGAMVPRPGEPLDEGRMFDANVRVCLNLGEWALSRAIPVVYLSGAIVYADADCGGIEETAPTGYSGIGGFYGWTKLLAEDAFRRLQQRGLQVAMLRPSSIYGAGLAPTKMLNIFLAKAAKGDMIALTPPIDDRVDLIHAADVARAVIAVLRAEAWDTFNLASGRCVSVLDIANACISVTGKGKVQVQEAPPGIRKPSNRFSLNCARAHRDIGWVSQVTLERGVAALFANEVLTLG